MIIIYIFPVANGTARPAMDILSINQDGGMLNFAPLINAVATVQFHNIIIIVYHWEWSDVNVYPYYTGDITHGPITFLDLQPSPPPQQPLPDVNKTADDTAPVTGKS